MFFLKLFVISRMLNHCSVMALTLICGPLLWCVSVYMLFMLILLMVVYIQREPDSFYLNQHIINSFSGQISSCMSINDVFTWANTSLLSNLFGVYPGMYYVYIFQKTLLATMLASCFRVKTFRTVLSL